MRTVLTRGPHTRRPGLAQADGTAIGNKPGFDGFRDLKGTIGPKIKLFAAARGGNTMMKGEPDQ